MFYLFGDVGWSSKTHVDHATQRKLRVMKDIDAITLRTTAALHLEQQSMLGADDIAYPRPTIFRTPLCKLGLSVHWT
jgi:hypothetical protein